MSGPTAQQVEALVRSLIENFTSGSILYVDSDGKFAQSNSALFFDATNSRLGLGTTSPDTRIDIEDGAMAIAEMTDPGASGAGKATLFVEDASGSTRLVARFPSGAAQVLATEQ